MGTTFVRIFESVYFFNLSGCPRLMDNLVYFINPQEMVRVSRGGEEEDLNQVHMKGRLMEASIKVQMLT